MKRRPARHLRGFTLLEMMLVLVIISVIIGLITNYSTNRMNQYRRDRASLQMQQILSAGMAYYINNGQWPTSLSAMQPTYLPTTINSPYNVSYVTSTTANTTNFSVSLTVWQQADMLIIAGQLPIASVTASSPWVVTGQVLIPGQNLNNARSVNYSGVFPNGTCAPVPTCPGNMTASIYVSPASVSGVADAPSCSNASSPSSCTNIAIYPVSSFTAYAVGGTSSSPAACSNTSGGTAFVCPTVTNGGTDPNTTNYWRICLNITTEKSSNPVTPAAGSNQEYLLGSIMVVTRCVPHGGDIPNGSAL